MKRFIAASFLALFCISNVMFAFVSFSSGESKISENNVPELNEEMKATIPQELLFRFEKLRLDGAPLNKVWLLLARMYVSLGRLEEASRSLESSRFAGELENGEQELVEALILLADPERAFEGVEILRELTDKFQRTAVAEESLWTLVKITSRGMSTADQIISAYTALASGYPILDDPSETLLVVGFRGDGYRLLSSQQGLMDLEEYYKRFSRTDKGKEAALQQACCLAFDLNQPQKALKWLSKSNLMENDEIGHKAMIIKGLIQGWLLSDTEMADKIFQEAIYPGRPLTAAGLLFAGLMNHYDFQPFADLKSIKENPLAATGIGADRSSIALTRYRSVAVLPKAEGDRAWRSEALFQRAVLLMDTGENNEEARACLKKLRKDYPESIRAKDAGNMLDKVWDSSTAGLVSRGYVEYSRGNASEAEKLLKAAIENPEGPEVARALLMLSSLQRFELGEPAKALQTLENYRKVFKNNSSVELSLLRMSEIALEDMGDIELGEKYLREALAARSLGVSGQATMRLVDLLIQTERNDEAVELLRRAAGEEENAPRRLEYLFKLAQTYASIGSQRAAADRLFRRIVFSRAASPELLDRVRKELSKAAVSDIKPKMEEIDIAEAPSEAFEIISSFYKAGGDTTDVVNKLTELQKHWGDTAEISHNAFKLQMNIARKKDAKRATAEIVDRMELIQDLDIDSGEVWSAELGVIASDIYIKERDEENNARILLERIHRESRGAARAMAEIGLARLDRKNKRYDEALERLKKAMEYFPSEAAEMAVEISFNDKNDRETAREFTDMIGEASREVLLGKFEALDQIDELSREIDEGGDAVKLFNRIARIYENQLDDRDAVIRAWESCIEAGDKKPETFMHLGDLYLENGDVSLALARYSMVTEDSPEIFVQANRAMSKLFLDQRGDVKRALNHLSIAAEADNGDNLADIAIDMLSFPKGRERLTETLQKRKDSKSPMVRLAQAVALSRSGYHREALDILQELPDDNARILLAEGRAKMALGDAAGAATVFEKALNINSSILLEGSPEWNLAQTAGRRSELTPLLRRLDEENLGNGATALLYEIAVKMEVELQDWAGARRYYTELVDVYPDAPEAETARLALRRLDVNRDINAMAEELHKPDVVDRDLIALRLGYLHESATGDTDKAREYYKMALNGQWGAEADARLNLMDRVQEAVEADSDWKERLEILKEDGISLTPAIEYVDRIMKHIHGKELAEARLETILMYLDDGDTSSARNRLDNWWNSLTAYLLEETSGPARALGRGERAGDLIYAEALRLISERPELPEENEDHSEDAAGIVSETAIEEGVTADTDEAAVEDAAEIMGETAIEEGVTAATDEAAVEVAAETMGKTPIEEGVAAATDEVDIAESFEDSKEKPAEGKSGEGEEVVEPSSDEEVDEASEEITENAPANAPAKEEPKEEKPQSNETRLLNLAFECYLQAEVMDKAVKVLLKIEEDSEKPSLLRVKLSKALEKTDRLADALEIILPLGEDQEKAVDRLREALRLDRMEKLVKRDPDNPSHRLRLGLLLQETEPKRAAENLEKYLRMQKDGEKFGPESLSRDAIQTLCEIYTDEENPARLMDWAVTLTTRFPDEETGIDYQLSAADMLVEKGDYTAASGIYKRLISSFPNYSRRRTVRAALRSAERGDSPSSMTAYQEAKRRFKRIEPDQETLDRIEEMREAVSLAPNHESSFKILMEIVKIYEEELFDFEKSAEVLESVLSDWDREFHRPEIYTRLINIYRVQLEDFDKAEKTIEAFVRRHPTSTEVYDMRLELADVYVQRNRYSEAIELYDRLASEAFSPEARQQARFKAARIFEDKLNDYNEAIERYEESAESYELPLTPEAYFRIAVIYDRSMEDFHKAAEFYRKLVDDFPMSDYRQTSQEAIDRLQREGKI